MRSGNLDDAVHAVPERGCSGTDREDASNGLRGSAGLKMPIHAHFFSGQL